MKQQVMMLLSPEYDVDTRIELKEWPTLRPEAIPSLSSSGRLEDGMEVCLLLQLYRLCYDQAKLICNIEEVAKTLLDDITDPDFVCGRKLHKKLAYIRPIGGSWKPVLPSDQFAGFQTLRKFWRDYHKRDISNCESVYVPTQIELVRAVRDAESNQPGYRRSDHVDQLRTSLCRKVVRECTFRQEYIFGLQAIALNAAECKGTIAKIRRSQLLREQIVHVIYQAYFGVVTGMVNSMVALPLRDECIAMAKDGILDAINSFDPLMGTNFGRHLKFQVQNHISRFLRLKSTKERIQTASYEDLDVAALSEVCGDHTYDDGYILDDLGKSRIAQFVDMVLSDRHLLTRREANVLRYRLIEEGDVESLPGRFGFGVETARKLYLSAIDKIRNHKAYADYAMELIE